MASTTSELLSLPGAKHNPTTINNSLPEAAEVLDGSIPTIDLEALHGPHRSDAVKQIGYACQQKSFFAVKNHGIPKTTVKNVFDVTREFFHLPEEERMKFYTTDPDSDIRLMLARKKEIQNVIVSRESLKFHSHPVDAYVDKWPANPPSFRKSAAEYLTSVRKVELALLEAISESLGMEKDYLEKQLGGQYVTLNYYEACEKPKQEATCGIPPHTDPSIITILAQYDVPGLRVLSEGKWMDVDPTPDNAVFVHVGDLLEVMSNSRYKSLIHRAAVEWDTERMSIASYCYPLSDAILSPPKKLIDNDYPEIYKDFTFDDFQKHMFRPKIPMGFASERLEHFKVSAA